jgi:hypothetical protein
MKTGFIIIPLIILFNYNLAAQINSDTVNVGDTICVYLQEPYDDIQWHKSIDNDRWLAIENETTDSLLYVINGYTYLRASVNLGQCDSILTNSAEFITNPILLEKPADFLFNIPIRQDTIYSDLDYGIDLRVSLEGYKIDTVEININDYQAYQGTSTIIDLKNVWVPQGISQIDFFIKALDPIKNEYVTFKSDQIYINNIKNLSSRYITTSELEGRLSINWTELDQEFTKYYLVEKFLGDNKKYQMIFSTIDSAFIDSSYVGEEAIYEISAINKNNIKQKVWQFLKEKETPNTSLIQDPDSGYYLNFGGCRYYNNFQKYYLTTGMNYNPDSLYSSDLVEDTVYYAQDVKFADEGRYWLRILPNILPENFSIEEDWMIYGHFFYERFGIESFSFNGIVALNDSVVVYTLEGNIYKRNLLSGLITDSIIKEDAHYEFLRKTTGGNYIYALDGNIYGSPAYFWSSDSFSENPSHTFQIDFIVPPVSDNLLAFMSVPSNTTGSKLAIYDIVSGEKVYTTDYESYNSLRRISASGEYYLTDHRELKLFSYSNNQFNLIYKDAERLKSYRFFDFDPRNNSVCYVWDKEEFSIRNTSDFSKINSFTLVPEEIEYIDYYSERIIGYTSGKIIVYDLNNGNLIKEIPANLRELFFYSNKTIIVGDFIYNNNGVKYEIK